MMSALSRNIIYGKTYCSIEHNAQLGKENISFLIAQTKKGELEIVKKDDLYELAHATEHLKKGQQVHLVINNSQVLFKAAPRTKATKEAVVRNMFANINISDFYYEIIESQNSSIAFICRKSYVDELIFKYAQLNIHVTSWSLGVSSIQSLISVLPSHSSEINLTGYTISVSENSINTIRTNKDYSPSMYSIEGIEVRGEDVLKLGGVACSFANLHLPSSNFEEEQQSNKQNYKQHRFYALGLPLALALLLLIFLSNFLVYNHYYSSTSQLSNITDVSKTKKKLLKVKDSIVSQKQKLFEDVIESASSSASLYIDQIIDIMPDNVLLSELTYQPLMRKVRAKKPLQLNTNTIRIEGQTRESESLSLWISDLEDLEFIQKAAITNLTTKGAVNAFTLELTIEKL